MGNAPGAVPVREGRMLDWTGRVGRDTAVVGELSPLRGGSGVGVAL